MINKDIALLAFRYALTQDTKAPDIVLAWFSENIHLYSKEELGFLMGEHSVNQNGKQYKKKREVWQKWLQLVHQYWKDLE